MQNANRTLRWGVAALAVVAVSFALAACGSSSGSGQNAGTLLHQTFSGSHPVKSGSLLFSISLNPAGSSTLRGPIVLSFGGPFQSQGSGKLPQSDFNVRIAALGNSGALGIISTGTNGYITFQGSSYQLPRADFQRLESSFSQLASSPGSSGSGILGKAGIQPLHWLTDPRVVGDETVDGAPTTHIHASINVAALLNDFNTFLSKAASLGVAGSASFPRSISPASRSRIATAVKSPSFDVWTGKSDKTVRKLQINLNLPVSGQISTLLGGLRTAGIGLSLQYANLNQPQTITAPANVLPYSQFQTKLRTFEQGLQSGLSGALSGGASSSSTGSSSSSGPNYQAYSQCIQSAQGDVSKMQRCASLLNGK